MADGLLLGRKMVESTGWRDGQIRQVLSFFAWCRMLIGRVSTLLLQKLGVYLVGGDCFRGNFVILGWNRKRENLIEPLHGR